jgi:hypothetical protein
MGGRFRRILRTLRGYAPFAGRLPVGTHQQHFFLIVRTMKSFITSIRERLDLRVSDETRLCFAASLGFFTIGGIGWILNRVSPGHNVLSALLAVGCFYVVLGVVSLFKKPQMVEVDAETLRPDFLRERESTRSMESGRRGPDSAAA